MMEDIFSYLAIGTGYVLVGWGLNNTPSNRKNAHNPFNEPSLDEVTPRGADLPENIERWLQNREEVAQGKSAEFFSGVPDEIVAEYELIVGHPAYNHRFGNIS